MNGTARFKRMERDVRLLRLFKTVTKTAQTVRVCAAAVVFVVIVFDGIRMLKAGR